MDVSEPNSSDLAATNSAAAGQQIREPLERGGAPSPSPSPSPTPSTPDRFFRWTEAARKALTYSEEEARQLEDGYIGEEHILLGLLRLETGEAHMALASSPITIAQVREAVRARPYRDLTRKPPPEMKLRLSAKEAVASAVDAARKRQRGYVASSDLLLSLCTKRSGGLAYKLLWDSGLNPGNLRRRVLAGERNAPRSANQRRRFDFLRLLRGGCARRDPGERARAPDTSRE